MQIVPCEVFAITGVLDTGNCKLLVSGMPGIAIPGVQDTSNLLILVSGLPGNCQFPVSLIPGNRKLPVSGTPANRDKFTGRKVPGVRDIGESQTACVPYTGESQITGILDIGKSFLDCSLVFYKLQTIATAFKATIYPKIVEIYYLIYKYILLIFSKNV